MSLHAFRKHGLSKYMLSKSWCLSRLLHVQVPLKAALPFLEGALRAAAEKRRNSSIVKSLRRSENLQLREEVIRCRQR